MASKPGIGSTDAPGAIDAEAVDNLGATEAAPETTETAAADAVDGSTMTGTVKKWNEDKGYGFLGPDEGDKDVFCHNSAISQEGVTGLVEGEKVQFTLKVEADGRLKAADLTGVGGGNLRGKWEEGDDVKTGTVARWRQDKGFGFITPDEGDKDIFAHVNDCGASLVEASKVEYTEQVGEDGRIKAVKVYAPGGRPLPEPAPVAQAGPMRMRMGMNPMMMQQYAMMQQQQGYGGGYGYGQQGYGGGYGQQQRGYGRPY